MAHPSRRRLAAALVAAAILAVLALLAPAFVAAHSELDKPTPADKSTVTTQVTEVSGTFTEAIKPDGSSLLVKDATGATVASGGVAASNDKLMTATPSSPLPNGAYTVQWTTISAADGDIARGTWTFTVAAAASPPASATAAPSASVTEAPTTAPTIAPTVAPSPAPSGGSDASGGGSDVILPIIVALIVLGAGAAYLLSRRGRSTPST